MGAQYSTGTTSPEWKGWLEERCSLETVRSIYQEFRVGVSSRRDNSIDSGDAFFITAEEFRRVFADVANYPLRGREQRIHNSSSLIRKHCSTQLGPRDSEQGRRMHLDRCFSCFDVLERGRVPSGVVWGGLALLTGASELGKIKFVLGMYDTNRDGQVNQTELRMAMAACATGFCRLHGIKPPPDGTLHSLAQEAFLHHAALEAALLARKATEKENAATSDDLTCSANSTVNPGIVEASATSVSGTDAGMTANSGGGGEVVAKHISAGAVSAFCSANARCRNFLKGVGASGSADLVMLYQREHELLRELVHVDSALDDYERRSEGVAAEAKAYASERGGDVRQLVVGGARVRALAEKWGVGRLLDPEAIRALLDKARGGGDDAAGKKDDYDDPAPPPANERHGALSSSLPRDGGGGGGIPWGKRGSPASGVDGIDASGAQDGGGFDAQQSDLGWAGDDFASEPEIQMQVLAEVGRLVRAAAAARRRDHNETHSSPSSSAEAVAAAAAAAAAAATAARELEAQTKRRAARQAERERGVKERARKAADNLGGGGWKAFTHEDSAKYAKNYKLGIAKKSNRRGKTSGQEEEEGGVGGVRLAALARGGGGGSTLLSGKEMRSYRDWELLKDKQAIENEESSALHAEVGEGKKDARWTTPFATRLDVDTLEDLVEGAGGFITDREAEGALAPEGELEKDQLGRVTLVGFVRWCRLREQRRVRAEARLRDPPPAWKQRLETWRKVWKEDVIAEIEQAKRTFSRRKTQTRLPPPSNALPDDMHGGGRHGSRNSSESTAAFERARPQQRGRGGRHAAPAVGPRYSKFAVSVVVPRPQQHDGAAAAVGSDQKGETKRGKSSRDSRGGNAGGKDDKGHHRTAPLASRAFSTSTKPAGRKSTSPAGGGEHHTPADNSRSEPNAAVFRSTIRLDIVKTDMERDGGSGGGVMSPARSGGTGPGELGSGGGGAAAAAKSDSSARELLRWCIDEQKKLHAKFWQEEGTARKDREAQRKAACMPKRQRQEEEAEEGRRAARLAPQVKEMGAVAWMDMPFLPTSPPPPPQAPPPTDAVQQQPSNETTSAAAAAAAAGPPPATGRSAASQPTEQHHVDRGPPSAAPSSRKGSVGSGSSSLLAALAAERDAAADFEAAEESAAERVAAEVRSFFNNIPRDYRNELGFTDVLVAVVQIRYRTSPSASSAATAPNATDSAPTKKSSKATTGGATTPAVSTAPRGARRVLRVAFFSDRDPFQISAPGGDPEVKGEDAAACHPLADLVSKLTVQLEMTADLGEILQAMKPWKNFKRRLYGPQEEELLEDSMDPRTYARGVLEEIQTLSDLLGQVPSMGFDGLRPILAKNGLSEVGTLAELSSRAVKVLEGGIKAAAGGGGLSKFGERAARILFRMSDRDRDGGLSFSEMVGMLRRMGVRTSSNAMASELDYLRTLKDIGVKTDTNGYLTEAGLVAFYREFGHLGDDIEASGVSSLNSLLGVKLSAVGQVDAAAAARLEGVSMEEHPLLGRSEKALSFLLRFANDAHLDCSSESLADWLATTEGDRRSKEWLMGPGWVSRAVEGVQKWLADGEEGVVPIFRDAATKRLGEGWAGAPPGWYFPGGDRPSFLPASAIDGDSRSLDTFVTTATTTAAATAATTMAPPAALEEAAAAAPHSRGRTTIGGHALPLKPGESPSRASGGDDDGRCGPTTVAPASEPPQIVRGRSAGSGGVRGTGAASSPGREGSPREKEETSHRGDGTPYHAAEKMGAKTNVGEEHPELIEATKRHGDDGAAGEGGEEGYERRRRNEQPGKGDELMTDEEEGEEDDVDGKKQEVDLDDVVVDAGALGDMEAAMEKAKALRVMLCSGLPSKVEADVRKDLGEAEDKARGIQERLQAATSAAIARGVRSYDAVRSRLEGVATIGIGTSKVTARLQVTGFPIFSLLPAGVGEPMAGRFEEEARDARAEMRRKVALDEIDRAKERQRLDREERERRRAEKQRQKEEEKLKEEVDLYERGLSARYRSANQESEKAQAEQYWRRLVALRQRRRKGTAGAAAAVNNLGVLLVEQGSRDSAQAAEGRKLLKAAVGMAEAGLLELATSGVLNTPDDHSAQMPTISWKGPIIPPAGACFKPVVSSAALTSPGDRRHDSRGVGCENDFATRQDGGSSSAYVTSKTEGKEAEEGNANDGTGGRGGEGGEGGCALEAEEWAIVLALFSSNLCFAIEGPGRVSDFQSANGKVEEAGREKKQGKEVEVDALGDDEDVTSTRCEALFESLSPEALSAASSPADSWECLDVGVSLFEEQDPFWWRRSHPEDEEERAQSFAEEMERRRLAANGDGGDDDGDYDGTRRDGVLQQRTATPDTPEAAEGRGGYTDLEVLEVLEPARAARIRLRQARHKAQQERQAVLRKRRKECQRKLRLQDAEAEAARAAMVQARDAWYTAARKTRKMQAAADKKARGRESGRFVKAAGAVKAWRARKFEPAELLAAGSNWTLRFAKSITNRINRVDDEELGGYLDGEGEGEEPGNAAAKAARARAAKREAVRLGAAARAKPGKKRANKPS